MYWHGYRPKLSKLVISTRRFSIGCFLIEGRFWLRLRTRLQPANTSRKNWDQAGISTVHGIFDTPDDLYPFKFPPRFVLKANHGSGWNYIHARPTHLNIERLARLSRPWLKTNYAYVAGDWAYKDVQPKLFCEEYLGTDQGCPIDYKFFCFAGKVRFIQADFDRLTAHKRNIYDCDWNLLDVQYRLPKKPDAADRPRNLSE